MSGLKITGGLAHVVEHAGEWYTDEAAFDRQLLQHGHVIQL
jgi:hypothetical protein